MELADSLARATRGHRAEGAVAAVSIEGRRRYAVSGAYDSATALVRLASVTKPMLACAALRAHGPGLLDRALLDDLPHLRDGWRAAPDLTYRHVFGQTTGLHPDLPLGVMFGYGTGDDALGQAVRHVVAAGQRFAPGAAWEYCNAGYWLAAHALAARAGSTFEEFLSRALCEPLGMSATTFEPEPSAYPRARRPAGGLWSTADDVLTFAEYLLADPGGAEILATTRRPVAESTFGTPYGLAWQVGDGVVWHNGDLGGFNTRLTLAPALGYAAFIAVRGERGRHIADDVMRAELGVLGLPEPPGPVRRLPMTRRAVTRLRRAVHDTTTH